MSELKKGHEIIVQYRIFPKILFSYFVMNNEKLLGCVLRVARGGGGWGVVGRRGREGVQEISVLI